ncbi:chaplin [Yinghuangia soli]|uniref:Chaplin n=1 Tax=Yinghuangia soli TaxID=2908204 RepID=A0AA41U2U7_9ACTN|nr:chaplin [Yinghuangia soli]MCF2531075.1 chaplin [Yinghuangia soli]
MKKSVIVVGGAAALVLGASGAAFAGSEANGAAVGSPGVLSGNLIQVPVHVPVNACGNTVSVIGVLNPAFGNFCANIDGDHHGKPGMMPQHAPGHHGGGHGGNW